MGPVYVVFDGDKDKWAYGYMKGWKSLDNVDFHFEDAHDLGTMTGRAQNETYVKANLKERMKKSGSVLVLVGDSTRHLHKFVRWEIDLALELGLPIIVANLKIAQNGVDTERCPPILRDACAVHIPYVKNAIQFALSKWPAEWRTLDSNAKSLGPRHYNKVWQ